MPNNQWFQFASAKQVGGVEIYCMWPIDFQFIDIYL